MEFLYANNGVLYCGKNPIIPRGMGLGGWLLPEGYMWKFYTKCDRPRHMETLINELCGENYADSFWKRYFDSYITEQDIAWIAGQGLNSVRLAINSRHLFDVDETEAVHFNEATLRHVDDCLLWCKKHGIYLFLDMHGAPGGQTGQNIDDSEADIPDLFTDERNQDILVKMWRLLAVRYTNEPAIGGYDLLNEPIPNWNCQYNSQLLPLYRRLIRAIREVDPNHVIILEGVHWATDFSVFEDFTPKEAADNIVLEFHKYWSDPDEESLAPFVETAKRLNVPLWMGEGGENNLQWYTYAFPMYERLGIGWCFWAYKKMEVPNSPVTFEKPEGWDQITAYLDGRERPAPEAAQAIFDRFLNCISHGEYHPEIIRALTRRPPLEIPAGAYDAEDIQSRRSAGAVFRRTSKAALLFADGHTGEADWRRYGGEAQPEDQKILLCLREGDRVGYRLENPENQKIRIHVRSYGDGILDVQDLTAGQGLVWITCKSGTADVESLHITIEE